MGLYSSDTSTGDLTALIASTPNVATVFNAANSATFTPFSASVPLTAGTRYCLGVIVVAAAGGSLVGINSAVNPTLFSNKPVMTRVSLSTALTDLPPTLLQANTTNVGTILEARVTVS
jgi:hypothetical protein